MWAAKIGGRGLRLRARLNGGGGRRDVSPGRDASEIALLLRGRRVVRRTLGESVAGEQRRAAVATDAGDVGVRLAAILTGDV